MGNEDEDENKNEQKGCDTKSTRKLNSIEFLSGCNSIPVLWIGTLIFFF